MAGAKDSALFINRELSWLEFNRRVLELSKEKAVPLGERLNFAAIYGSNLDEFFMIRVGALYDQSLLKSEAKENKTGMTPQQQIDAIMPRVAALQKVCDKDVAKAMAGVEALGYSRVDFTRLDKAQHQFWKKFFLRELFPVLSPQIIGRRHPFPFLRNMETYVGAMIREGKNAEQVFGLLPVSTQLERIIYVADGELVHFALVEELVLYFADIAFGNARIEEKCLFRVTRNADINVEEGMFDHDLDYRVVMGELLKKRRKQAAVRLQFKDEAPAAIKGYLREKLLLPEKQLVVQKAPLDLSCLQQLRSRLQKTQDETLFYAPVRPLAMPEGFNLYEQVRYQDVLLCYPYHNMRPFIAMLRLAAKDPAVVSIKMTLYRVARDSQIIDALISAAENGKEVVTIVELRARFDEQNNIDWSRQLEQAGCTVIYGFSDFKVHSKLTLITRKKDMGFEYITSIGTGNYNEKTSELYTDLAYLTSKQEIGEEVGAVFNDLAMERLTQQVNSLIVAPLMFKTVLLQEIKTEMEYQQQHGGGQVILKCNSISDKAVIEALSEAAQGGVPVDMIVRGICCLQAGLPGISEGIRVHSIVGRFLEHSRIFAFGTEERLRIYIASGDFLTRNTERRVEVGVRIDDEPLKKLLYGILQLQMKDNMNTSVMQPDGSYKKLKARQGESKVDSQLAMYPYLTEHLPRPVKANVEKAQPRMAQGKERAVVPVHRRGRSLRRLLRRKRR